MRFAREGGGPNDGDICATLSLCVVCLHRYLPALHGSIDRVAGGMGDVFVGVCGARSSDTEGGQE